MKAQTTNVANSGKTVKQFASPIRLDLTTLEKIV